MLPVIVFNKILPGDVRNTQLLMIVSYVELLPSDNQPFSTSDFEDLQAELSSPVDFPVSLRQNNDLPCKINLNISPPMVIIVNLNYLLPLFLILKITS